jgi:hypothetical protein
MTTREERLRLLAPSIYRSAPLATGIKHESDALAAQAILRALRDSDEGILGESLIRQVVIPEGRIQIENARRAISFLVRKRAVKSQTTQGQLVVWILTSSGQHLARQLPI